MLCNFDGFVNVLINFLKEEVTKVRDSAMY